MSSKNDSKKIEINENKKKALEAVIQNIERQFGKGSVMRLGDSDNIQKIEAISTGSLTLDRALGIGGLPKGRIVEIYGPESSGKTSISLQTIAQAQKNGELCAFIDAEHALDPEYAAKLGVDLENLYVAQPDTGEQALEILDNLVRSKAFGMIVVDSVAALVPKAEIEGDMGDSHMGLQARLMSQGLRKVTGAIKEANTLVIFINQIRMKIGVMFGSPETTTGGNALKFYASVRLDIRRTGQVKEGEEVVGVESTVKVIKNKVAPPFKQAKYESRFKSGIDREGEVIDLAVEYGIVEKSGAWYSYNNSKLGQGKEKSKDFLKENNNIYEEIFSKVRVAILPEKSVEKNADKNVKNNNKEE